MTEHVSISRSGYFHARRAQGETRRATFGLVVGGGPAPGINGVIAFSRGDDALRLSRAILVASCLAFSFPGSANSAKHECPEEKIGDCSEKEVWEIVETPSIPFEITPCSSPTFSHLLYLRLLLHRDKLQMYRIA